MKKLLSCGILLLAVGAWAQTPGTTYVTGDILDATSITANGLPATLTLAPTTEQTVTVSTRPIPIVKGASSVDIVTSMVATNSSTANVILTFKLSSDGVTKWTTPTITVTNVLNGTTAVVSGKTIGPVMQWVTATSGTTNTPNQAYIMSSNPLQNARYLHLVSVQNVHNATISVSRIQFGQWK